MISVFCDGLCEPCNPGGWACWAWLALDDSGSLISQRQGQVGIEIKSDSSLVIEQVCGRANALSRQAFAEAQEVA
jgi:ribonuclease HI